MLTAIVLIKADPGQIATLGSTLAAVEGVAEVYSVAGDEDLVAIIRVADYERVAQVVTEHIAPLEGLLETRTLIAFRQYDPADVGF
jgi:DNA-binding Lrp family transcriptional regulator